MKPIFVGGTGRSGTTVMKRALLGHDEVVGAFKEIRFIIDPGGVLDAWHALADRWSPYAADRALWELERLTYACTTYPGWWRGVRKAFSVVGITPPRYRHCQAFSRRTVARAFQELEARVCSGSSASTWLGSPPLRFRPRFREVRRSTPAEAAAALRTLVETLYASLDPRGSARYWIDDTPFNFLAAAELRAVFPDMRLVHVHRDPRDVVASHLKQRWGGGHLEAAARRVKDELALWAEVRAALPPGSFVEVALEDLVRDTAGVETTLSDFLELDVHGRFKRVDPSSANLGRWKKELSPQDQAKLLTHFP